MRPAIVQVDAFTNKPFSGNPALAMSGRNVVQVICKTEKKQFPFS